MGSAAGEPDAWQRRVFHQGTEVFPPEDALRPVAQKLRQKHHGVKEARPFAAVGRCVHDAAVDKQKLVAV